MNRIIDEQAYNTDTSEAADGVEPGSTICIRVPASLKQRVDDAAAAENVSVNAWAMRILDRATRASVDDAMKEIGLRVDALLVEMQKAGPPLSEGAQLSFEKPHLDLRDRPRETGESGLLRRRSD